MAYIEWNEGCELGFHFIDAQHHRLVDLINKLSEAQASGDATVLRRVFQGLFDYTVTHFAVEEELMVTYAYPEFKAHKGLHDDFKGRVVRLHQAFGDGDIDIPDSLLKFLRAWLMKHILTTDRELIDFLRGKVFIK